MIPTTQPPPQTTSAPAAQGWFGRRLRTLRALEKLNDTYLSHSGQISATLEILRSGHTIPKSRLTTVRANALHLKSQLTTLLSHLS